MAGARCAHRCAAAQHRSATIVAMAQGSDDFELARDAVRWTGRADGSDSPTVTVVVFAADAGFAALARAVDTGDARAGDEATRAVPMPHGMLDALARRCVAADETSAARVAAGVGAADARWVAALARTLIARGGQQTKASTTSPAVIYTPPDSLQVRALHALEDGRVAALSTDAKYGRAPVRAALAFESTDEPWIERAFEGPEGTRFALPRSDGDRAWLIEQRDAGATIVREFDARGVSMSSAQTVALSPVQRVTVVGSRRWLHCERHHALLDEGGVVLEHGDPHNHPLIVGQHLLTFSVRELDRAIGGWVSRTLRWIDLADASVSEPVPWNELVHSVVIASSTAFAATARGVFALVPGRAPELLFEGAAHGLCARGDRLLWTSGAVAHEFNARSRTEERAIRLETSCFYGWLTDGCAVVSNLQRAFVYDRRGALVYDSGERREPSAVALEDGTTVVSAGEEVTSFDRDGRLVAQSRADYDGQLVGATERFAIYGPVSGGYARTEPTGLLAFDARARGADPVRRTDALPVRRPLRTRYGGGTESDEGLVQRARVLLVDGAGAVRAWAPRENTALVLPEPKRRPTERAARVAGFHTSNPRDDWPVAGVDVSGQSFLSIDSLYRGTTGVSPERAVIARDGAVVTLVRCDLAGDGGGATVRQRSTLVLIDCRFDRSQISVEAGSHLVVLSAT
jgi:hypothetical protein